MPAGVPDLTLGWEAVRWASKYLRQPNGPRAGERFEFVESQIRFLLHFYAVDESGQWVYRRAVRRLAKGSGKSPFAALMALVELCAPVRLDRFDPSKPGGVVGKPVAMPLVQIAATAEPQTYNTMRMVSAFAPKGSRVVRDHGLEVGRSLYYKAGGGKLHIMAASSTSAEGAESTFIVGDETEHWSPGSGGPKFAATLADNLAKSGSRMLETCNAWEPGAQSVAEGSFDAWVAQEEGRTKGASEILYDARLIPADTDWADERSLMAGLEFVYGDCYWQTRNLQAIKERIWDPQADPNESMRKYGNRPSSSSRAWVTALQWSQLADPRRVVTDGEAIAMFLDVSLSRDATALVGCCMSDGHVFLIDMWEPDTAHNRDDTVSSVEVDAGVARAFRTWDVVGFFSDVYPMDGFAKITWPDLYGDELLVKAVPGGKEPQPIAWDMRFHTHEFTMAAELTEAEIREAQFTHDGDSRLARHVTNAWRHPNKSGVSIGKGDNSSLKIDGAVSMIGARMVRRLVLASSEWVKRSNRQPSVAVFF